MHAIVSSSITAPEPAPAPAPAPLPSPVYTPVYTPSYSVPEIPYTGVSSGSRKLTVKGEAKGSTVTLTWNKIKGAKSYTVYMYRNGSYTEVKTTSRTTAVFNNMKNGTNCKFLVRYTLNGKLSSSANSGKVTVKVNYKPVVTAVSGKNSAVLKWQAVPGAEKYAVYKYVNGNTSKLSETKATSAKIGRLSSGTEYCYIVRAYVDGKWTDMSKSDAVKVKTA